MAEKPFPGIAVGVTGGIGSGKSMVCSCFAQMGRMVIHADPLAKELMESDAGLKSRLQEVAGTTIFGPDGRLDTKAMADIIFGSHRIREQVNAIVHPAVFAAIRDRLEAASPEHRSPFAIIEAALIYESGLDRFLSSVIVVDAPLDIRLGRIVARDGTTRAEAMRRDSAQMSPAAKARKAAFIIRNTGTPEALAERVRFLDALLRSMYGQ